MTIRYLGCSSFLIKTKEGTVLIDPFNPDAVGLPFPKVSADIVLVTHDHPDHNNVDAVKAVPGGREEPFVIHGPGEYELSGIKVWGFSCYHDKKRGSERGKNTVYLLEAEGLMLCHLGDLGEPLDEQLAEEVGNPDILFVPTGGVYTIDHEEAAQLVGRLEPKIVVPMHYKIEGMGEIFKELSGVSEFLEEMGVAGATPQGELKVAVATLPEETEVVVLKAYQ